MKTIYNYEEYLQTRPEGIYGIGYYDGETTRVVFGANYAGQVIDLGNAAMNADGIFEGYFDTKPVTFETLGQFSMWAKRHGYEATMVADMTEYEQGMETKYLIKGYIKRNGVWEPLTDICSFERALKYLAAAEYLVKSDPIRISTIEVIKEW